MAKKRSKDDSDAEEARVVESGDDDDGGDSDDGDRAKVAKSRRSNSNSARTVKKRRPRDRDEDIDEDENNNSRDRPVVAKKTQKTKKLKSSFSSSIQGTGDTIPSDAILFLAELKGNSSNRDWFADNKPRWETIKSGFESFVDKLKTRIRAFDAGVPDQPAKEFIFRINRDVRFGGPLYKTSISAAFPRKDLPSHPACFYLHIEPGNASFIAGGIHCPQPSSLAKIRAAIAEDEHHGRLAAVLSEARFKEKFGEEPLAKNDALKTAPKGYARDHAMIDLLRLKSFAVSYASIKDSDVLKASFLDEVTETFRLMHPYVMLLNDFVVNG